MCGGPADGRWVVVQDGTRDWECLTANWTGSTDPAVPAADSMTSHRYSIVPVHLMGRKMYAGVIVDAAYLSNDDSAILRTLLQRDVAQHLGAYR
jgi:hypothetical protein